MTYFQEILFYIFYIVIHNTIIIINTISLGKKLRVVTTG